MAESRLLPRSPSFIWAALHRQRSSSLYWFSNERHVAEVPASLTTSLLQEEARSWMSWPSRLRWCVPYTPKQHVF